MRAEREEIVEISRRMVDDGLTVGTSGNVSVREDARIAITPSGVDTADLTPEAVCVVDLDGERVDGDLEPSSEIAMHTSVYRAYDAGAVVHTHPMACTAVGLVRDDLPAVHYMIALMGGTVRVAPYATFGSEALAQASVTGLADRTAVILRNHGATTYGPTLRAAYDRAVYLEWAARLFCEASALGSPAVLDEAEVARVAQRLAGYGQTVLSETAKPPEI